jgi:hypothetical protein
MLGRRNEHLQVGLHAYVCIWQDIEFGSSGSSWDSLVSVRKGGGYVVQHSGRGKGSQHSCFRD